MDRRSVMSLLIFITIFLSTWHIMLQQQEQFYEATQPSTNNFITPSMSAMLTSANESAVSDALYDVDSIPKNDFSQLIDLTDFQFVVNTMTCRNLTRQPLVVILVHSAPGNFDKRRTIRETWGERDERALLRFFVGRVVNNTNVDEKLSHEMNLYGDIVQGSFEDTYWNLTYKHVMVLKWFVYYCPNAKYLLKTDDDVLINTPLLYDLIESPRPEYSQLYQKKRVFCSLTKEVVRVKRTFRSKWRVSFKEYPDKFYPLFCPGYVILYTADVVPLLYQVAQKLPYFRIDDVHITGTAAVKSNVTVEYPVDAFALPKEVDLNKEFLFLGPNADEEDIRRVWKEIKNNYHKTVGYDNEIPQK